MRIMSYNVAHCQAYPESQIDYQAIADVITASGADVVGLNEVFDRGGCYENQTEMLACLTGLSHWYFARATTLGWGPYGNGLLSRIPIVCARTIPIPDPEVKCGTEYYETRCILKATLANGLTVMSVHFGLNQDEQKNAMDTVLANLKTEKCILMGDFNVQPDNPLLQPLYARMTDAAGCFEGEMFSFPSDAPNRKLDYIFVTGDILVNSADIPAVVASDHRPHIADICY